MSATSSSPFAAVRYAVEVLGAADTVAPPPRVCSCCGGEVTRDQWMANSTRRLWREFGLEIAEHTCKSTLAEELYDAGALVVA